MLSISNKDKFSGRCANIFMKFYISFSLSTRVIGSDAQSRVICAVTHRSVGSILFGGYFLSSGSDRGPEAYLGEGGTHQVGLTAL